MEIGRLPARSCRQIAARIYTKSNHLYLWTSFCFSAKDGATSQAQSLRGRRGVTTAKDPARTPQRTYEDRRKSAQDACRKEPCHSAGDYPKCVWCYWEKRRK